MNKQIKVKVIDLDGNKEELTAGVTFPEKLNQPKEDGECVRCQVEDIPAELLYIGHNQRTVCKDCIVDYLKSSPEFYNAINNLTEED